jgi:hypothetical protein
VSENAPEITACEAITAAQVARITERNQRPLRREQIERVLDRCGVLEQQGALPEIVEHQRGHHEPEPRAPDRRGSEVSHVGVQRFRARDGEDDGAEREECETGSATTNQSAWRGSIAAQHGRVGVELQSARIASTTNHTHITGPNRRPTVAVPRFWIMKSPSTIASVTGTMNGCSSGR